MINAGIALFFAIAFMAFWILIFLFGVAVPYWVQLGVQEKFASKKRMQDVE